MGEIYRLRLDRGDLVLESLIEAIKRHDIQDGAVGRFHQDAILDAIENSLVTLF